LFGDARWSGDALGLALVDLSWADCSRRILLSRPPSKGTCSNGLEQVFGATWHYGGAARGRKLIGFGNGCIIAGIVVQLSSLGPGDLGGLTDDRGSGEGRDS
jgi:hypothetical protein